MDSCCVDQFDPALSRVGVFPNSWGRGQDVRLRQGGQVEPDEADEADEADDVHDGHLIGAVRSERRGVRNRDKIT